MVTVIFNSNLSWSVMILICFWGFLRLIVVVCEEERVIYLLRTLLPHNGTLRVSSDSYGLEASQTNVVIFDLLIPLRTLLQRPWGLR